MSAEKNTLSISRRNFWKLSGAALGSISLATITPSTFAKTTTSVASEAALTFMPSSDNPIRLNFNENSLGMSPKALQIAIDTVPKAFRYADAEVVALKEQLAKHYHVSTEHILLTHGSTEGMRACMEAFSGPNAQYVGPELTYGDGERLAKNAGMSITKVPHNPDWSWDMDGLKKAAASHSGTSVVYLVNPNNPTSTITAADEIEAWIKSKPANTIFVVDEAYAEFVDDPAYRSVAGLIQAGIDNVALLKTFSKIHAMAGMRVGYVLSVPQNIEKISLHVGTEDLNYCGVCAASASLADATYLAYSKESNRESRKILTDVLDELGLTYLPSQTNFVFHTIKGSLKDYRQKMLENHIMIGKDFPPATDWCRISLGTPQEMQYVAASMRGLREKGFI